MKGIGRVRAASTVLQRARLADPTGGVWEASDVQWWWRAPRPTDDLDLPVWLDDDGVPVGVVLLTAFGHVQADALVVPGTVPRREVWDALLEVAPRAIEVLVRDDDAELLELVTAAGLERTDEPGATTWLDPAQRPPVAPIADGYVLVDRTQRTGTVHPMVARNHPDHEVRLQQTDLYDPSLDLSIETVDGEPVGYALFWHDTTTGVGQLEPMRVFDEHQRRGLASALLTEGLDRLARRGATRLKVGFSGPAGKALYLGAGFQIGATDCMYRRGS
ncbi:MAG TPA: GNAT family N-acetyltransferase [Acidimicrobiales bacterium]|nr:GNAT family N-acetyltransferase [Acidimicrobiales bacterium]